MFWKSVRQAICNVTQCNSVRARLMLSYTAAAFILLTLVAAFLYWETINNLYKADYQFLSDETDTIRYVLDDKEIDLVALREVVVDIPRDTGNSIYRYYVRVVDDKQRIIMETPGIKEVIHDEKKEIFKVEILGKKRYWHYTDPITDNEYLMIAAPAKTASNQTLIIQIVLDITHQHAVLKDRNILILILSIIALSSLLLGLFIARQGTRSLYELTETVKQITASSLNQRINPQSWPKELRQLGLAFNQMLDRIQSSYSRLNQFSSDLAHELRTPLNNLVGETEVALSYSDNVDEMRRVMESNLEELNRMGHMIENILFLARAENPELELKKKELDVAKEIAIITDFYQAAAEEKNITVSCQGEGKVIANSVMFRRMLSNLLSNALHYTAPGGWVKFTIDSSKPKEVIIIVADNGIGIAPSHLPHIFDRFYRVDSARTQSSGGIGLGLAIVKSIVELHGGSVTIASELGKGTEIRVRLVASS